LHLERKKQKKKKKQQHIMIMYATEALIIHLVYISTE